MARVEFDSVAKTVVTAKSHFRWVVAALIFTIYTIATADRANIGIALPYIRQDFHLSNTEAGALISLFFITYSLGQFPAGFIISRLKVRRMLPMFMVLTSLFTALTGTAGSIVFLKLWRICLGLAEAPLPLAMLSTINRWFPPREKGTATGIFLAAAKFGPVVVPPIGAMIIASAGWRPLFFFFAVPGFLLAPVWFFLVKDDPKTSGFVSPSEGVIIDDANPQIHSIITTERDFGVFDRLIRYRQVAPVDSTRSVFWCWDIWGCGLAYLLMTGVVNVLLAWLPTYLATVKHFTLINVGVFASLPFVGGVLGNIAGGFFSDRLLDKRRKPTMIVSAIATTGTMLWLVNTPNNVFEIGGLLFAAGFLLNIGYSSYSVYSMGRASKQFYPVAASLVNAAGQAGGAIAPFVTGVLLDAYDWNAVFIFLSACALGALGIILTVVEPRPQGS